MTATLRTIWLFTGWIATGVLAGVFTSFLSFYFAAPHSNRAPGDGILALLLLLLLIPLGAIGGVIGAITVWEKRKGVNLIDSL